MFSSPRQVVGLTWGSCGSVVFWQYADMIIEDIRLENKEIDPDKIETDLEKEDRLSILFYGGADLSHDAVVAATSKR